MHTVLSLDGWLADYLPVWKAFVAASAQSVGAF